MRSTGQLVTAEGGIGDPSPITLIPSRRRNGTTATIPASRTHHQPGTPNSMDVIPAEAGIHCRGGAARSHAPTRSRQRQSYSTLNSDGSWPKCARNWRALLLKPLALSQRSKKYPDGSCS